MRLALRFAKRLSIALALLALAGPARAQEDKVFRKLTPEQTEEMLKKFDVDFKKVDAKAPGVHFYDFKRKSFNVRLYHFEGKDVMLDAVFPKLPLEKVNEWNVRAKFSRACYHRNPKGEYVTLESNLDLLGGVTEGTIKQFIQTFEEELKTFARFHGESGAEDQLLRPLAADKLEGVLRGLGVDPKKTTLPEGVGETYVFEADGFKIRLTNFNGKDLMLECHFKKLPLEDVNRYNLEKKFIRAVAYDLKGKEYTALECNLDCEAGTTVGIVRGYVLGYLDDVKSFAKYVEAR